jgi:hypothetical protein
MEIKKSKPISIPNKKPHTNINTTSSSYTSLNLCTYNPNESLSRSMTPDLIDNTNVTCAWIPTNRKVDLSMRKWDYFLTSPRTPILVKPYHPTIEFINEIDKIDTIDYSINNNTPIHRTRTPIPFVYTPFRLDHATPVVSPFEYSQKLVGIQSITQ